MDGLTDGNSAPAAAASPVTFADAFAPDASSAPDPSTQSNDAPAAAQPATDSEITPASDERSPFIPRARFDEVNTKLSELRQWKEQYGWVEDAQKRAAFEQAVQIGQMYSTDRAGYIRQMLSEAINDPQLAPAVRSEAARLLGQRLPQQPPAPQGPNLDDLVIDLGNGQTVPLSALKESWTRDVEQKFAPVVQTAEALKTEREHAQKQREATEFAGGLFSDLQKRPDFAELRPALAKRLASEQLASDHPAEVRAAAYRIYLELREERRTGDIAKAKSEQLDDLQRRAAASTAPNPGSAAPTTPKSPKSFHDPSLVW